MFKDRKLIGQSSFFYIQSFHHSLFGVWQKMKGKKKNKNKKTNTQPPALSHPRIHSNVHFTFAGQPSWASVSTTGWLFRKFSSISAMLKAWHFLRLGGLSRGRYFVFKRAVKADTIFLWVKDLVKLIHFRLLNGHDMRLIEPIHMMPLMLHGHLA